MTTEMTNTMIPAATTITTDPYYPAVTTFCSCCEWRDHAVSACVRVACGWRWQRIGFEDRQRRDLADGKAREEE